MEEIKLNLKNTSSKHNTVVIFQKKQSITEKEKENNPLLHLRELNSNSNSPQLINNKEKYNINNNNINNNNIYDNTPSSSLSPTAYYKRKIRRKTTLNRSSLSLLSHNSNKNLLTDLYEKQLNEIIKKIKNEIKIKKNKIYNIPFKLPESYDYFQLLLYTLPKKKIRKDFLYYISYYLTSFDNLKKTINQIQETTIFDSNELLLKLSNELEYDEYFNNQIIMRYGDYGDKFYLIIHGKVGVIIKKEIKCKMSKYEYYLYLLYLLSIKENGLYEATLDINKFVFSKVEFEIIINDKNNINEDTFKEEDIKYCRNIIYNKYTEDELENLSIDKYIEICKPILNNNNNINNNNNNNNNLKRNIIIYNYYKVAEIKEGGAFGDIALFGNFKRTATIITMDNCIFGIITKKVYDNCIMIAQRKVRRMNVSTILNCELFKYCSVEYFDKNYFNYFSLQSFDLGKMLFRQGDERKYIYFLKKGEIAITSKISYNEINKLIIEKGGYVDVNREKREIVKNGFIPKNVLYWFYVL